MNENDSAIHGRRVRHGKGHESIRREALQDTRLSFKALGILSYLLSLPDNWKTNSARLGMSRDGKEGQHAVRTGLGELEEMGYLLRKRVHLGGGKWKWIWEYTDDPETLAKYHVDTEVGFSSDRFPSDGPPSDGPPSRGKPSDIRDSGSRGSRGRDLEEENPKDLVTADAPTNRDDVERDLFGEHPASSKAGVSTPTSRSKTKLDELWHEFWSVYPRKNAKIRAQTAWTKAVKQADPREIINAAARYAQQQADPWRKQFTKYPATWLNDGCWEDEPEPAHSPGTNGNGHNGHVPYQQTATDEDYIRGVETRSIFR